MGWGGGEGDRARNSRHGKHIGPVDPLFLAPDRPTGRRRVGTCVVGRANRHHGGIGDQWLDALEESGRVRDSSPDDALLETVSALDGPDFTAADVDPAVRDFYEHTASWRVVTADIHQRFPTG